MLIHLIYPVAVSQKYQKFEKKDRRRLRYRTFVLICYKNDIHEAIMTVVNSYPPPTTPNTPSPQEITSTII